MLFWKKNKKLVIRCLTTTEALAQLLPITRMSRSSPDWWRQTDPYFDPVILEADKGKKRLTPKHNRTVKHCYALQKLWENSIAIPLWSDFIVSVMPDGKANGIAPNNPHSGEQHPVAQFPGMISDEWAHFKMVSPWLIYTEEPVQFMLSDPFYHNQRHEWMTMPGEMEFFYQHHTNINMVFRRSKEATKGIQYEFFAGDILAYLSPRTERDFEVVCETIEPKERQSLEWATKISFHPASWTRKKSIGGCPLGRD